MIFVTVGSQLPFDRLIHSVDKWAKNNPALPVFAQIGISSAPPHYIEFCQTMSPETYHNYLEKAQLIIAHAGTGTIISALEFAKPLLLMPRLASQGEHRNDHQLATTKYFSHLANIRIAHNEAELLPLIDELIENKPVYTTNLDIPVSDSLINTIKEFINSPT